MKQLLQFLKSLFIKKQGLGLQELPLDSRDLQLGAFWSFGAYTPKHSEFSIPTLSVKSQVANTCSFNSSAAGKEVDEQVILSVRFLVAMAKKKGLISGDGFANLRASESILAEFGCCEERLLPGNINMTWEEYSNPVITQEMLDNAVLHKTKSYFFLSNYMQAVEQIEAGHPVKLGVRWRTNMNMNGGFSLPWLLNFLLGFVVGGHAFVAIGHNQNYQGKRVLKCQNSYGKTYGIDGCMYIAEEDFNREVGKYGATVNLDLPVEIGKFLVQNNNKLVKLSNDSRVWLIEGTKKRLVPDEATMYSHGYADENIIEDTEYILPAVIDGEPLDFWSGNSVRSLKAVLLQRNNLKPLFKKYFSEILD